MEQTGNNPVAYCRICGKALPMEEQYPALGTIYCSEHVPAAPPPLSTAPPPDSPWTVPPTTAAQPSSGPASNGSPGLAFVLGLIPGVGAIYNGQYAKGMVHVLVFGLLLSMANADSVGDMQPLFGMLAPIWVFYMAFEAFHTAKRREQGLPVEEFSSVIPIRPDGPPVGPALMIGLGVLFLLNNMGLLRFSQIFRMWPLALIATGIYMLIERGKARGGEARHDQ